MKSYEEKCSHLHQLMGLYTKQQVAVAFSGGVDSSLLLKLAVQHAALQDSDVLALTAVTELHPASDEKIAARVASELGAAHLILHMKELEGAGIQNNPKDRCYRCKHYLFSRMRQEAKKQGITTLMEGTNADDILAYRPGIRAVKELGIKSPLLESGFTKEEVRRLAGEYGISVAERPSLPCLATRFPYGVRLDREEMKRVEQGEKFLRNHGFYNIRLRVHDDIARIEVDYNSIERLITVRQTVIKELKKLGYVYITLDLEGFRSGGMDIQIDSEREV